MSRSKEEAGQRTLEFFYGDLKLGDVANVDEIPRRVGRPHLHDGRSNSAGHRGRLRRELAANVPLVLPRRSFSRQAATWRFEVTLPRKRR